MTVFAQNPAFAVAPKGRACPPFRAEHIGSLLRPPELLTERARFARGEIGQAELTAAEDAAVRGVIALQEELGFKFVTDGEYRRRSYHSFFYGKLGKLRIDTISGADAKGAQDAEKTGLSRGAQPAAMIGSRVQWTHPINAADVAFLKAGSQHPPKITIPGPCALHFRGGVAAVLASAYKDVDQFWSDIVEAFAAELNALAEAGCNYVQIDETAFAKFGDPDVQASLAARGDDWSGLFDKYIAVTNRPMVHIDAFGTVVLPIMLLLLRAPFLFGYAKPVPVNFRALRHPRVDTMLVAAAGPGMNLLLAMIAALGFHAVGYVPTTAAQWLADNLKNALLLNVVLAIFNLLPIPPLDGGRILSGVLPAALARSLSRVEPYGLLILIAVLFVLPLLGAQLGINLDPISRLIMTSTNAVIGIVLRLTGN